MLPSVYSLPKSCLQEQTHLPEVETLLAGWIRWIRGVRPVSREQSRGAGASRGSASPLAAAGGGATQQADPASPGPTARGRQAVGESRGTPGEGREHRWGHSWERRLPARGGKPSGSTVDGRGVRRLWQGQAVASVFRNLFSDSGFFNTFELH